MLRGLAGKTAIVTGGSTIIGRAVVSELHGNGAAVVIADIDDAPGEALAAELGERVAFQHTDITDDAQVAACVEAALERFGRLDILVNLACSYLDEGAASPRADWTAALDVNVVSAAVMARAVHPHLVAQGGGAIVNFASISAKVAQTGRWLYPVSKAALVQLTRNMAMDLAPDGIRVNSVSPGWTWSKVMDELSGGDRAKTDGVARAVPPARTGRRPGGGRAGRRLPLLRPRELRHRSRLGGGRRLLGDGARAVRARDPETHGMTRRSAQ